MMRVWVYFDYSVYHRIRKWMQRHPEYEGSLFTNDGLYMAKFDIDATDPQKVAYFFHYFAQKNVTLLKMKKIDPWKVLRNFNIMSYRPFEAEAKQTDHDEDPSYTFLSEGGPASPPSHTGRSQVQAGRTSRKVKGGGLSNGRDLLVATGGARSVRFAGSNPAGPTYDEPHTSTMAPPGGDSSPPTSGDTYEYAPKRRDYE